MEEKNIKTKIIGTSTFGIMMITLGVIFLISMFTNFSFVRYTFILWPIFLIALGVEALYYNAKGNVEIKWSIISLILIGITLFASLCIGCAGTLTYTAFKNEYVKDRFERRIQESVCEVLELGDIEENEDENVIENE